MAETVAELKRLNREDGDRSDAASEAETPIPDTYQVYQVYQTPSRGLKHTFSPLIRTGCVFHT